VGTKDTYQRTLLEACLVAGGEKPLAEKLGVSVDRVLAWLLADESLPTDVFLRAVDIVLTDSERKIRDTGALLAQLKAQRAALKPKK
jgi:hypothetical protein